MLRAAWFIKISSAYNTGVNESKGKKRIMADPASGKYKCICYLYYSFTSFGTMFQLLIVYQCPMHIELMYWLLLIGAKMKPHLVVWNSHITSVWSSRSMFKTFCPVFTTTSIQQYTLYEPAL